MAHTVHTMKIDNVIDFVKTLNSKQRAFFFEYQSQIKMENESVRLDRWDTSHEELAEIEQRRRGEQGIFG